MPALPSRFVRHLGLLAIALLVLPVACRLDRLLKPTGVPHAVLMVTPTQVEDTARAHSDDVQTAEVAITNGGSGKFKWSASDRADWLRLDPRDGDAPGTLVISMDPEDLGPGTYREEVSVVAKSAVDSQSTVIAVTFVVERPGLNVSPTLIERTTRVGSNEAFTETIQIHNSGTGELNWTASDNKSWISLGRTSGSGDGSVPVTISSIGLERGTYRGEVEITSPGAAGSPATVDVTLLVVAPGLAVTPNAVHESASVGSTTPVNRNLRVSNSGNGTLTWTATKTQAWLTLSRTSGSAPPSGDVTVTLNPTGLLPGMQRDTIVFTSPEVTTGPLKVPVEFEITQPGLVVAPASISATAQSNDPKTQTFDLAISNSAAGALAWVAGANAPWIAISPLGGLTPSTLTVTVDPKGLPDGTHTGAVTVTAPGAIGSPFAVPVQLVITRRACNEITIDPDVIRPGTLDDTDCDAPHRPGSVANLYAVSAAVHDTLSIRLVSNDFDAYLFLTDGSGNVLAQNDDCSGEIHACIRQFPISVSGRYLIEATSKLPGARGPLTITVIRERAPSMPQELRQWRADGSTSIGVGEAIPEAEVVITAKINDPNLADSVRLEVELRPTSISFTGTATHQSAVVAAEGGGTSVTVRAGSLTNTTGFHWRARTCDKTARCSPWISFGNNAETDADFTVAIPGASPLRPE